jgi:imidazolonepropionase-like amidohydrolase
MNAFTERVHDNEAVLMANQPRKRWKLALKIALIVLAVLVAPALIPPGRRYDPAPYFLAVKQSAALPATKGETPLQGDLIIRRARIVDVNGVRGPTSIRIEAGRITAIAEDVGKGPVELDVGGATVMPGLVDAHAHLSLTPGGLTRHDDAATTRELRLHHMRAYLACGITTIFDPAVENVVMEDIQRSLAAGHAGPRYLGVGTPLTTPGGYGVSLWPPGIRRADEVGPHLDAIIKAGAVGVKMTFERGFVAPVWRLHPPEVERAIVEEAAKRKLPIYVHAERADMVRRALAVHPHALVHGPIDGTKELAAEIAAAKIPVVTTLALFDAGAVVLHPEQLEEPHIRRVVPALVLQSVRDRRQYRDQAFGLLTEGLPFMTGRYRDLLAWIATTDAGLRKTEEENRKVARSEMETIRLLKAAGVPLVMGSDSGNWPLFPYYFHGPTSWRELRLLADAGLSPQEVLRAATVNPFRMLGLEDRLGTVDVGKVGDLVVVRDDPLVDVEKAMRSLQYTIRAGVARTPDEWMTNR